MLKLKHHLFLLILFAFNLTFAQTTTSVSHFDRVIISPHIAATFVEGDTENVSIEQSLISNDKINIRVSGKTLRVYLEDAKELTKSKKVYENGYESRQPIYKGTIVTITVTYKTLHQLSVRGEETIICKSILKGDNFRLKLYGETHVIVNEVNLKELHTAIYGESFLEILAGSVTSQKYTAYGESKVNSLGIKNNTTKITSFGEAEFRMNVSDEIRITAFGEAKLGYRGNPAIIKGINIGNVHIDKID